jgi:hypothetical protein
MFEEDILDEAGERLMKKTEDIVGEIIETGCFSIHFCLEFLGLAKHCLSVKYA